MIRVFLSRIKTRDGINLEGIYVKPRRKSNIALVWLHGLGSNFARGQTLMEELSAQCQRNNIGYFKFNNRGHDAAVSIRKDNGKNQYIGDAFEKFTDCVLDIRAIIGNARKLGYRRIILIGHSTGANKALYYIYKTKDRSVKGLILLGPVSDIAAGRKKFGTAGLARGVELAERLSRKNPAALMPALYGIFSARRFLSLFRPGGAEDVFPYLNPGTSWKELKGVRAPIAVIFGPRDEYLNRPAKEIIEIFRSHASSTKSFSGVIIRGADHGFRKKEKELSLAIIQEIQKWGLL